jgi:hypothetical protein
MVSVVDGGSNLGCVKPKAIQLLVAASMVNTQHSVVRENTCFVTVNGHKYSSPSIVRYIFHIKPLICLSDSNFCLHGFCFLVI